MWWFAFRAEDEFVLGTDSLCEWFTAEEMTELVAAAQAEAGTQFEFAAFDPEPGGSLRRRRAVRSAHLAGQDHGRVVALSLSGYGVDDPEGEAGRALEREEFVPHELLGDGVTYGLFWRNDSVWSAYNDGPKMDVVLRVEGHDDAVSFRVFAYPSDVNERDWFPHEEVGSFGFAAARLMLEGMGWID